MIIFCRIFLISVLGVVAFTSCDGGLPGAKEESEDSDDDDDDNDDERPVEGADEKPAGFGQLVVDSGISTVPNIVDPVLAAIGSDSETEEFDSTSGALDIDAYDLVASTGIGLDAGTKISDFDGKSYAACEMVNRMRGLFHFAAAPDLVSCELSYLLGDTDKFYDGKFHVVEIKGYEDGDLFSERLKFKIQGSKAKVTGLTVYRCEDGEHLEYMDKQIAEDGTITIYSKHSSIPRNSQVSQFWGKATVVGKVDENQKYVGLKTINSIYSNQFSNGSVSYVKERLVQSSKNLFYTGYMSQDGVEDDRFAGFTQLIDKNTSSKPFDLENYYLGDGALAMILKGEDVVVQGWNGDTKGIDNTLDVVERVLPLKTELPEAPGVKENLKFEGDEKYDCAGTPDLVLDDADLFEFTARLRLQGDDGEGYGGEHGDDDDDDDMCSGFRLPQEVHLECQNGTNSSDVAN